MLLGNLSGVVVSSDRLLVGQSYTFTYDAGIIIGVLIGTTDYILTHLRPVMVDFCDIINVDHAFLSKKFTVTIVPKVQMTLEEWINYFRYAWDSIGYTSTVFIQAESGVVSTQQGGIKGEVTDITTGITDVTGQTISSTLSSLSPILLIAGVGLAAILFIKVKK
jgi:hypothetical protein